MGLAVNWRYAGREGDKDTKIAIPDGVDAYRATWRHLATWISKLRSLEVHMGQGGTGDLDHRTVITADGVINRGHQNAVRVMKCRTRRQLARPESFKRRSTNANVESSPSDELA